MIKLIQADSTKLPLNSRIAQLVYCDPPWNIGMNEGGSNDRKQWDDYLNFIRAIIKEATRIAWHDSWLIITVYNKIRYPFEKILWDESPWIFSHEIIWSYSFGKYTRRAFVPSHDNVLIYKLGNPPFNWEAVAVESWRQRTGDIRADSRGRTPSSVWEIPRVPGDSKERRFIKDTYKRSVQPMELATRLLLAFTNKGDQVVDLFCGSGTLGLACKTWQRNYIGIDICKHYLEEAQDRIDNDGWLKFFKGK